MFVYLHGFASGPTSSKARYFASRFRARGLELHVPALDRGDFEHLTISRQYDLIAELAGGRPVTLIGSSMGGYLAALYASRHPETRRLVMMAPAFDYARRWAARMGDVKLRQWRESNALPVYHYGAKQERSVGFDLMRDALGHPGEPAFNQPGLILHGRQDSVVPVECSERFAAAHPNVTLKTYPSGHELTDVLPDLWAESERFLFPYES